MSNYIHANGVEHPNLRTKLYRRSRVEHPDAYTQCSERGCVAEAGSGIENRKKKGESICKNIKKGEQKY